ncbi:hypothetical protein [Roseobacter sp. A03A-229]
MLNLIKQLNALSCAVALTACTTTQSPVPIRSDPVYDKLGNALCTAEGAPATHATAAGARPCAPGDDGCVGSVTVDGDVIPCRPRGDCSYISVTVPCVEGGGRDDASSSNTSDGGRDPSSPTAAPI